MLSFRTDLLGENSKGWHPFFNFFSHFPPSIAFLYLLVSEKRESLNVFLKILFYTIPALFKL
jgi:hypothetical protein